MDVLDQITALATQQGMHLSEVSERIGKPKQYLSNALKHRNPDGSRRDPRFSTVVALCEVLNTTPDALLGKGPDAKALPVPATEAQGAEELITSVTALLRQHLPGMHGIPSFQDVLQWWHVEGGRIERLGRLKEYFDIYEAPNSENSVLTVCSVGSQSLSSKTLGVSKTERLQNLLNVLSPPMASRVTTLHRTCHSGKICTDIECADIEDPDEKTTLNLTYSRLLLPVTDRSGRSFTLNYSQEISHANLAHA